ncbi:hypothetical protein EBR43_12090 [bacterium]|nr:hypothetical protein [bacterium]
MVRFKWYLLGAIISIAILGCYPNYGLQQEDITNMYASYVSEWQDKAKASFDESEAEIFIVKPKPDDIVGPNPDVSKCVCKGTGIITQGDGHKTPCPFHHKGDFPSQKLSVKK